MSATAVIERRLGAMQSNRERDCNVLFDNSQLHCATSYTTPLHSHYGGLPPVVAQTELLESRAGYQGIEVGKPIRIQNKRLEGWDQA